MLKFLLSLFRLFRAFIVANFLAFFIAQNAYASPDKNPLRVGLWVEAEGKVRPFESLESFTKFRDFSGRAQFTDLYCQVYRGGRSWFPSMLADDKPYRKALEGGLDPLRETIKLAKKRGQKVHAWINILRIINNRNAPLIKILGKEAVLTDNHGNSLLSYTAQGVPPGKLSSQYALGTPGYWLEPSHKPLRDYLVEQIKEVLVAYPELDGIHLDMMRQPIPSSKVQKPTSTLRFGSGKGPNEQYSEFSAAKKFSSYDWKEWRKAQYSLLVYEIREMLKQFAPEVELSAAVIADQTKAENWVFQDWKSWLKGGVIDTAVPMAYTSSKPVFKRYLNYASNGKNKADTQIGIGAWLMLNQPTRFSNQIKQVINSGMGGVTLFSYSNLMSKKGYRLINALNKNLNEYERKTKATRISLSTSQAQASPSHEKLPLPDSPR